MTTAQTNPNDDLSKPQPTETGWWDEALKKHESKRCTANKKNGQRCRKFAIYGTNVCRCKDPESLGHVHSSRLMSVVITS